MGGGGSLLARLLLLLLAHTPLLGGTAGDMGTIDLTGDSPVKRKSDPHSARAVASSGPARHAAASGDTRRWVVVEGDDCKDEFEADSAWRGIVAAGAPFEDAEFPAEKESIEGPPEKEVASSAAPAAEQRCRCGQVAKKSVVGKDTPNKGRPYFHCALRRCGFFSWADNQRRSWKNYDWKRFPSFVVVSDFGFSAEHLRQGGVGDCWFLSALAVVAERHDLIAKLFKDTARNTAGCYNVRLFLDGKWQPVLVDDRLPCTRHASEARRPEQVFDTGLAFSRAANAQLWAYAKAHGSYRAISGGQIAEALLDLTGAPALTINFDEPGFSLDRLWGQLVYFKSQGFPMGCATGGGDPQLREVGLCGNHAYSILECREIRSRASPPGLVRLLRIRNPHGVGEWNGDWSDASAKWSDIIGVGASSGGASLERTGVNDGTFWMDLTHFVMGFQLVDVCMAYRDWHARLPCDSCCVNWANTKGKSLIQSIGCAALLTCTNFRSFDNAFCARTCPLRVCRDVYRIRIHSKTTLYVSALQPSKRGSWCRADRKKSYKLGDVSLLVVQVEYAGRACGSVDAYHSLATQLCPAGRLSRVVGGGLHADSSGSRCSFVAYLDDPAAEYLVIPYSLGGPPTAAEVSRAQPFTVRFFSNETLRVCPECCADRGREHDLGHLAATALQVGLMTLGTQSPRGYDVTVKLERRWQSFGHGRGACVVSSGGVIAILAINQDSSAVAFEVQANVKVMLARTRDGLLVSDDKAVEHLNSAERQERGKAGAAARGGFKWLAKWKHFRVIHTVPGTACDNGACSPVTGSRGWQQVVMLLIPNGVQAQMGSLTVKLAPDSQGCYDKSGGGGSTLVPFSGQGMSLDGGSGGLGMKKAQTTLKGWFNEDRETGAMPVQKKNAKLMKAQHIKSIFDSLPLREETLVEMRAGKVQSGRGGLGVGLGQDDEDAALAAALAASRASVGDFPGRNELEIEEERMMKEAIKASAKLAEQGGYDEDTAVLAAIAASESVGESFGESIGTSVERRAKRAAEAKQGVIDLSNDGSEIENGRKGRKRGSDAVQEATSQGEQARKDVVIIDICGDQDTGDTEVRAQEGGLTLEAIREARLKRFAAGK